MKDHINKYLTPNRIEFAITYLCNSKCKHCYSIKNNETFPKHINKSLAVETVRKVGEQYSPESIMTFGGEPLLFPEIVSDIHKEAMDVGIPSREIITNGYWSKDAEKIKEIAKNLKESGVNEIIVSVDTFHQEQIPLDIVRKTIESCLQEGFQNIILNPCWVVSEENDNRYNQKTKSILQKMEDLPVRKSEGNIMEPAGLALINLKEFLPPKEKLPAGKCGGMPYTDPLDSIKGIYIEPDGKVAVCNDFYIGNAFEADIISLIENYNPFKIPVMKSIIENGMEGLLNWAKAKGVQPDSEGYYSICQMCIDIRRRVNKILK
ncbi:MAG: radical SAM protein [Candidatus Cloacimonetes bacterium]|nr:radical SAM protein [Candidatus Cloacimonadota bacterium]